MTFSPHDWAKRFKNNADEANRNSLMDGGWSASAANRCAQTETVLYRELVAELAKVTVTPADLFDRPQLAAVIAAAQMVTEEKR